MNPSPIISRILNGDLCSGCGLCTCLAGEERLPMEINELGYLRPRQRVELPPQTEVLIGAVCPGVRLVQKAPDSTFHPIWGPILKVRVGYATDPDIRFQGSSGGALTALTLFLVETGRVQVIKHTGASNENPLANRTIISRNKKELLRGAGSRYSPSSPLTDINGLLASEETFAVVGKPCDIAGLRALNGHDRRVETRIPYMLSFFCAGIPSLLGARKILDALGVPEKRVVAFRYRGHGWPGSATAETKDGQTVAMSYEQSWGGILSNHLQFRCKICPDGNGGFADVACGDPWYEDETGMPSFKEQDGQSLIISRTERGEELVRDALASGYIEAKDIEVDEIARMQPYQARRKGLVPSRLAAMWAMGQPRPHYKNLNLLANGLSTGLWQHLRSFLGMIRRLENRFR